MCPKTSESGSGTWENNTIMKNKEKIDIHQQLMDEAYEEWQKHAETWDKDVFFDHLDFIHRVAVALGNLNYQVRNGGFAQWHDNGYSESHYDFLTRLDTKEYSRLTEGLMLMCKAYSELKNNDIRRADRGYDDDEDRESSVTDQCDTAYYKLKNIEKEMNEYLISLQKKDSRCWAQVGEDWCNNKAVKGDYCKKHQDLAK